MRLLENLISVSRDLAAAVERGDAGAAARLAERRQVILASVDSARPRLDPRRLASVLLEALSAVEPSVDRCRIEVERIRVERAALADQARALRAYLTGAPWRSV